jgi:cytochrome P450
VHLGEPASFLNSILVSKPEPNKIPYQSGGYLAWLILYYTFLDPLRDYPGPFLSRYSRLPYWIAVTTGNQVRYMVALHTRYGPVVRFSPTDLSYNSAEAWKDIYHDGSRHRPVNRKDLRFYPDSISNSILNTTDDVRHAHQRRLFSSAFGDRGLKAQESMFRRYADIMVLKLREADGKEVDMVKMFNCTTFDIMSELIFGESLGLLRESEYSPWVAFIFYYISVAPLMNIIAFYPVLGAIFAWLEPTWATEKRSAHLQHTIERVDRRMQRRNAQPDIWTTIQELEASKGRLTRGEMYDTAGTLMVAGTETIATLLSGLTYYLLTQPEKLDILTAEVRGSFETDAQMTFGKLRALPYLNACIEEALRVYPPVPTSLTRRTPEEGNVICGRHVPGNVSLRIESMIMNILEKCG